MKIIPEKLTAIKKKLGEIKRTGENSFSTADYFNTANALTLFRILLIWPTIVLIQLEEYLMALSTIIVAYSLDFLTVMWLEN